MYGSTSVSSTRHTPSLKESMETSLSIVFLTQSRTNFSRSSATLLDVFRRGEVEEVVEMEESLDFEGERERRSVEVY